MLPQTPSRLGRGYPLPIFLPLDAFGVSDSAPLAPPLAPRLGPLWRPKSNPPLERLVTGLLELWLGLVWLGLGLAGLGLG